MNVTINNEQKLFVIKSAGGYSCFGFENCFREATALAQRLGVKNLAPTPEQIGKLEQYEAYLELLRIANAAGGIRDTWYDLRTPEKVRRVLENARIGETRLRIFYGDTDTGRDWLEEFDVIGRIARSSGILKVPLIIESARSNGGPAILDACIVRIVDVASKRELYRHPTYTLGNIVVGPSDSAELPYQATVDGELHARFKTMTKAQHWAAFMQGTRMTR